MVDSSTQWVCHLGPDLLCVPETISQARLQHTKRPWALKIFKAPTRDLLGPSVRSMASTKSTPPEAGDSSSLSHQINASILSSHTTLNRLILDRMPRAVPPHTDNPSAYITGLLHIGAVYIAFESLWQNLIGVHSEIAPIPYTFPFNSPDEQEQQHVEPAKITARTRRVLEEAYSATMLRAPRIKADVQAMTGWPDHVLEQQLKLIGTSGRLGKFTLHIRDTVNKKPHILLAYAHTLYLALLSGGSYIRTELMFIDRGFWEATPTPIAPGMVECRPDKGTQQGPRQRQSEDDKQNADPDAVTPLPLQFLDFDPPLGANPRQQTKMLKVDLKARLTAADALLADPERRDIIAEAGLIFHHLEGMVGQLDTLFAGPSATPAVNNKSHTQRVTGGVGARLRDSIAIAKGRLLRTRRKSSGSSVLASTAVPVLTTTEEDEEEASRLDPLSTSPSSVSASSGGDHGAGQAFGGEAAGEDLLARDAVVPQQGFRTIRYGSDLAKPDRKAAFATNATDVNTPHSFDGASDQCCPMSRRPTVKSAMPDYALYATIVSNFVLLGGVMGVFAAWLWVRHGETVMII